MPPSQTPPASDIPLMGWISLFCGPKEYWPKERTMKIVEENVKEN
jgi:hypothetical protein